MPLPDVARGIGLPLSATIGIGTVPDSLVAEANFIFKRNPIFVSKRDVSRAVSGSLAENNFVFKRNPIFVSKRG